MFSTRPIPDVQLPDTGDVDGSSGSSGAPGGALSENSTWVGYSLGENRSLGENPASAPSSSATRRSKQRDAIAAAVGVLGGAAIALWFGGEPTGFEALDAIYLVLFGAFVALGAQLAGRATRVAALAPCILLPGAWLAFGAAAAVLVLIATFRPAARRGLTLLLGLLLVFSYLHLGDSGIPRLSAGAVALAVIVLIVSSIRNTRGRVRGALEIVAMSVLFTLLFGAVNLATVLYQAKPDLDRAAATLDGSLGATDVGSIENASADLILARRHLVAARSTIESTWAGTGRLVPIAAQNYQSLVASLDAIERSTIAAARTVDSVDVSAIRSESGGINVAALEDAERNARSFRDVLVSSVAVFEAQQGPWLLSPLVDQLATGSSRSRDAIAQIDTQLPRLETLPKLLGATKPRRYLVLVANPTETRDLGGFTGGFAVVEMDAGQIELIQSGRATDLEATTRPEVDGVIPDRFGDYEPWSYAQNYTGTPDLTVAANTLRELFPAMGGTEIDGVVYLDPYALGALTDLTGPVEIAPLGLKLDGDTLPQFLVIDQYALIDDRSARTSVLDVVTEEVFRQLQFGGLPSMGEMIDVMSPMVSQGRLRMVTFDASETDVLTDLGLTQRFRPETFDDFLSVMHANGGPNKLDPYLHRTISYEVATADSAGTEDRVDAILRVDLENRAPEDLSDYVSGNRWDLERGTNRLLLIVHSPLDAVVASVDGNLVSVDSYYEYGLWRHELFVAIPAGQARTVEFELAGRFGVGMVDDDPATHELWVHHQPTVNDDNYDITVNGESETFVLTESARLSWPD